MQQLILFGCLLAVLVNIVPLHGESISYIGDVAIRVTDTEWKCDRIFCPADTHMCRVTKQKIQPTVLQRVNICFGPNGEVLMEAVNYDPIGAYENMSLNITSYRTGSVSTSSSMGDSNTIISGNNYVATSGNFDQQQFDDSMANVVRINAQVEANIRHVNEEIQRQMQYFNQQFQQNMGNWYNGWSGMFG